MKKTYVQVDAANKVEAIAALNFMLEAVKNEDFGTGCDAKEVHKSLNISDSETK